MVTTLEEHPDRENAIALLAEGFDMLEEGLDKGTDFAPRPSRTYWESSATASPRRVLMQTPHRQGSTSSLLWRTMERLTRARRWRHRSSRAVVARDGCRRLRADLGNGIHAAIEGSRRLGSGADAQTQSRPGRATPSSWLTLRWQRGHQTSGPAGGAVHQPLARQGQRAPLRRSS